MSGLMSGDGNRDGALASAPAPILDSTTTNVLSAGPARLMPLVAE